MSKHQGTFGASPNTSLSFSLALLLTLSLSLVLLLQKVAEQPFLLFLQNSKTTPSPTRVSVSASSSTTHLSLLQFWVINKGMNDTPHTIFYNFFFQPSLYSSSRYSIHHQLLPPEPTILPPPTERENTSLKLQIETTVRLWNFTTREFSKDTLTQ